MTPCQHPLDYSTNVRVVDSTEGKRTHLLYDCGICFERGVIERMDVVADVVGQDGPVRLRAVHGGGGRGEAVGSDIAAPTIGGGLA